MFHLLAKVHLLLLEVPDPCSICVLDAVITLLLFVESSPLLLVRQWTIYPLPSLGDTNRVHMIHLP